MKRLVTLVATTLLLVFVLPGPSAQAVNSLTWTVVVDCDDVDGSSTGEPLFVTVPTGWYAVEVSGACAYSYPDLSKCVSIGWANRGECTAPSTTTVLSCPWIFYVAVDDQCPAFGGAGLVYHDNPGPMRAKFVDCSWCYGDNEGYFVVTVTWTAL